ncbi:DUF1501 domain-containing protein [Anaerolineae bacterium CFX7]|nr:DUF1501 domain-containing protein [Anaerolineae bacterium CFX7]
MITRRTFLQSALAGLSCSVFPGWMPRLAFTPQNAAPRGDVLVCLFLRGAADALNIVVPYGEAEYYRQRPTIAVARPDDGRFDSSLRAMDLDGFFGLHPALAPLLPAWQQKELAFVHACGAPDESRSHFQAMELMERGVEAVSGPASGWLGRHLASLDTQNNSPLRALSIGERVPRMLHGNVPATALRSIADFHLKGNGAATLEMQRALARLYADDALLGANGRETLDTLALIAKLNATQYTPRRGVQYPDSELGMGLKQIAALLKAEVGLEIACVDVGGWDTHVAQGGGEGAMAELLRDVGASLAAFYADVRADSGKLSIVVMSEFGRRVQENGGLGTDHGHGSVMWLLGGGMRGGRVHGEWNGLQPEALFEGIDLAVTTDYRNVLGEILFKRLGNPNLDAVFPNYRVTMRGVTR